MFLHADERGIDEVLNEEPRLEFARADDVRDEEVIGAVITECGDTGRRLVCVAEDQLMRLERPADHVGDRFGPVRRPLDRFGDRSGASLVVRYGEPPAEGIYILHEGPYGVFNGSLKEFGYYRK